jgi:hypothetical protein
VRPYWRRWLVRAVTAVLIAIIVGLGAVNLLVFAVLVGLLSMLVDIAPAEVSLPVMQLGRPAVCLGGPVMRLGRLMSCPLPMSVGPLLELGHATHLLGRRTLLRLNTVVDRLVVVR